MPSSHLDADTDEETRSALAQVACVLAERVAGELGTLYSRAAFREAVRRAARAWAREESAGMIPAQGPALKLFESVMLEALEDGFAEWLEDLPENAAAAEPDQAPRPT